MSQTMALAELIVQSTQVLLADRETPRHFARLRDVDRRVPSFRLEHTQRQLHDNRADTARRGALVRYRAIAEALVATLSDGAVLLNLQTKRYFSLNETGTRIWEMVQQTADEEAIVATLLGEYDVEESMARTEVRRILDELIEAQLIVPA